MSPTGQITVYPANRLEDLALLLETILSLALAQSRGICMNTPFPMPGNFIWQLVRRVLGGSGCRCRHIGDREKGDCFATKLPIHSALERQVKLGASCRVQVPVG